MLAKRIIPCLDVTSGRVVKGVNFVELRDAGDPVKIARRYDEQGADELTFLDITASSDDRDLILHVIEEVAAQVFIPLTVGGGIRSLADVTALLTAGADKISVGSAGVSNPELLREISSAHGNQILVISLDLKRGDSPSGFVVTTHGGRKTTELDGLAWVQQVQELGAGELLVNSIDADGTQDGFDLELIELIKRQSSVPVIASGGAGSLEHFVEAAQAGADAVLAASVFHNRVFRIDQVNQALRDAGFEVR